MRAGLCSIQLQALTPEAANVVKQAVSLATRRGHAQVTPLHVASSMLTTSSGLLRRACLQCHSHPLQCKALELCFNVALNRLPASTPSPLLGPHYATHCNPQNTPSLSNALVAAFKRAQSHQRRGSIETQNQPILALKIEIEQLVISILDDPSVSRVMREAGFSSTLVKSKVEQSVSIEVCSQQNTTTIKPNPPPQLIMKPVIKSDIDSDHHDVGSVVSEVLNRKRNVVVVGESVGSAEGLARRVMERLGSVVQVVSVPLVSFRDIRKEEVERKVMELRCLVKSHVGGIGRGVVLYLGDLKWLVEFWATYCCDQQKNMTMMMMKPYCSVEHMVMELKRLLVSGNGGENVSGRVWLMGVSSFKTYMKCKSSHPSLETLWDLHPFTIPVPSLSLSLNIHRNFESQDGCFEDEGVGGVRKNLTCCRECSLGFEKEAQSIITSNVAKKEYNSSATTLAISSTSTLPTWLQNCKEERESHAMEDQENSKLNNLCKKWNSFCNSVHKHPSNSNMNILEKPLLLPCTTLSPSSSKLECELYTDTAHDHDHDDVVCCESNNVNNLIMFMPHSTKPDLLSNPNSSPNSASSSEAIDGLDSCHVFKDLNEENLKILSDALLHKVSPQYSHVVREISSTVLRCRSESQRPRRQDTWMAFSGDVEDSREERESVSRELAKVVFGSYNNFVTLRMTMTSGGGGLSLDEKMRKRKRESEYLVRFGEAVNENPHRVFFMEDLDHDDNDVDGVSEKGFIKEAIRSGSVRYNGELIPLKDAIIILSCERDCGSNSHQKKKMKMKKEEDDDGVCLDLNIAIEEGDCSGNIVELVDQHIVFKTQENVIGCEN